MITYWKNPETEAYTLSVPEANTTLPANYTLTEGMSKVLYVPAGMTAICEGREFAEGMWVIGDTPKEDRKL
jgi:hypothetical protein